MCKIQRPNKKPINVSHEKNASLNYLQPKNKNQPQTLKTYTRHLQQHFHHLPQVLLHRQTFPLPGHGPSLRRRCQPLHSKRYHQDTVQLTRTPSNPVHPRLHNPRNTVPPPASDHLPRFKTIKYPNFFKRVRQTQRFRTRQDNARSEC